jgi:SAM-dependent methyltransferase
LEQVQSAYGEMADQYARLFDDISQVHPDDLAMIERHLSIRSGTVLDVGCGPGHLTAHLRSLGVDATGIDLVPEFVDHARAAHPESRFEQGSMLELTAPDQTIAGVLAWYSLIHLPPHDLDGVLTELRRTMVPGGKLVTGFFHGDEIAAFDHKVVQAFFWPVDELSDRLSQAGFAETERLERPGATEPGQRPHAVLAAIAH